MIAILLINSPPAWWKFREESQECFWKDLILGFSLIAAIGPQNAFVLRQGLARQHVFLSALATSFCDMVLILISVLGAGRFLVHHPTLKLILTLGGIAFLSFYTILSFKAAFGRKSLDLEGEEKTVSRRTILLKAIGFSWINPHALLDVVLIIGSISAQYDHWGAMLFGFGCIAVSFLWFFSLALFAIYRTEENEKRSLFREGFDQFHQENNPNSIFSLP